MAAYVVVLDFEISDQEALDEIRASHAEIMEANGGTYLASGHSVKSFGQHTGPVQVTVVQYDSMEALDAAASRADTTALRERRSTVSRSSTFIVDGV